MGAKKTVKNAWDKIVGTYKNIGHGHRNMLAKPEFFEGTQDKVNQIPLLDNTQTQAKNQLLQQGLQGLLGGGNNNNNNNNWYDMFGTGEGATNNLMGGFNGLGGQSGTEGSSTWGTLGSGLGSLAGGALGAYLGGPGGAAIGKGLGSWAGEGIGNWLGSDSKDGKNQGAQQYTYESALQQLGGLPNPNGNTYESALQQLGGLPNENQLNFGAIRDSALGNFNEQTVPGLAKRFGAMGSGNQRSSAFANALSSGAQGLNRDLAAQEQYANIQNFSANQAARQSQQLAAMNLLQGNRGFAQNQQANALNLLQGNRGFAQNQQRLGQNQQELNLRQQLGMRGLDQTQQQNQQQLYQTMIGAGLTPNNQNVFMAGKPGFNQQLASALPAAAAGYLGGGPANAAFAGFNNLNR